MCPLNSRKQTAILTLHQLFLVHGAVAFCCLKIAIHHQYAWLHLILRPPRSGAHRWGQYIYYLHNIGAGCGNDNRVSLKLEMTLVLSVRWSPWCGWFLRINLQNYCYFSVKSIIPNLLARWMLHFQIQHCHTGLCERVGAFLKALHNLTISIPAVTFLQMVFSVEMVCESLVVQHYVLKLSWHAIFFGLYSNWARYTTFSVRMFCEHIPWAVSFKGTLDYPT